MTPPIDYGPPRKRSLTLRGHRTSVSLEDAFWTAFRRLAAAQGKPVNGLAAEIDEARGIDCGLAAAMRLYVLAALETEAPETEAPEG